MKYLNLSIKRQAIPDTPTIIKERKKLNRLSIMALVVISALFTIVYVWNVFQVNQLLREVEHLSKQYEELKNTNDVLRGVIIRLQEPERITKIASEKLGMITATEAPEVLTK